MARNFVQNLALGTFISFMIVIASSFLLTEAFGFPLLRGGPIIIILAASVGLSLAFGIATGKGFSRDNVINFILVLAALVGVIWATKHYIPELYSILISDSLQGGFSSIGI